MKQHLTLFVLALLAVIGALTAQDDLALIHIVYERIEVEQADFSDWLLENTMSGDGTELRKAVHQWGKDKRAEVLDIVTLAGRSGQRAKVESVESYTYPTEPGVPEIPNIVELEGPVEAPVAARTASAFETRNLGVTLEVDPVLGLDEVTIDLNLAPEAVVLDKLERSQAEPEGNPSAVDMPLFHVQKITTQVTVLDGRYAFLGTTRPLASADSKRKNPLVLNFVRADVGKFVAGKKVE